MTSGAHAIAHGDVLAALKELPSNEFDGLFCDPPYGFSFMGKKWDYDVPSTDVWAECLRVLKPGAPLLAFGGARTFHRIVVGIEDAGFEIRDVLMWLYGKGFPKSQNIGLAIDKAAGVERAVVGTRTLTGNAAMSTAEKGGTYGVQVGSVGSKEVPVTAPATALAQQWDGYGTALKPAYEPIVLARKPLQGTMAANVAKWGVGGLAIDACRIGEGGGTKATNFGETVGHMFGGGKGKPTNEVAALDVGRWPANVLLDEVAAAEIDASVAPTKSVPYKANKASGNVLPLEQRAAGGYADAGGPSRYFYCAKVSTKEREFGCESLPKRTSAEMTERSDPDAPGTKHARAGAGGSTGGARNHHPTLKPIALTEYLARLILPPTPGAQLLIPYSGAGSEVIGALQAGWPLVFGIEGEAEYIEIANARIAAWAARGGKAA